MTESSIFHLRRAWLLPLAVVALIVLTAARASTSRADPAPPDHFHPATVDKTLQAGESTTIDKTLDLTGLPAKADIIVAIDNTGSMDTAIAQAKADANNICNNVQSSIPGARFAVVAFRDYGEGPYTLLTPGYDASCANFSAAIATMFAAGGGDAPEAYNTVFHNAYSDAAVTSTHDPEATQFLVVLGDAAPHNSPAPAVAPSCGDTGNGGEPFRSDPEIAALNTNSITLLMIHYLSDGVSTPLACYQELAGATGGDAVDSTNSADIDNFIIANAEEVPYTVDLAVDGDCPSPVGLSFNGVPPYGPFQGPQEVSFQETITAPTTPGTYSCTVTAVLTPGGPTEAVETINLEVTPADPATLTLTPETATNTVDAEHCVTAAVIDAFGNVTPGISVEFSVSGSVTTGGSAVTDASGEAQFCYTGPALPGSDTISAFADTNGNMIQDPGTFDDPGEPSDIASKKWVIPASTPGCKITDGGRISADNGDKATFGANAQAPNKGEQEYQDHGPAMDINVHSIEIQAVVCSVDKKSGSVFGTATINGAGSFDFRVDVQDLGEPGKNDTYRIRLSNGYDSGVQVLNQGNIQIHK